MGDNRSIEQPGWHSEFFYAITKIVVVVAAALLLTAGASASSPETDGAGGSAVETVSAPGLSEAGDGPGAPSREGPDEPDGSDAFDDPFAGEARGDGAAGLKPIADPLEPFNRAMFVFNDKLYFWALKPVARGYGFVVPEKGRVAVRRFFTNLTTPIRLVNSALQFKFRDAGAELARFGINTTVGVFGFMDPARDRWDIYLKDEDFGQTLGAYGAGPGFYITLPVFGPSSARDAVGLVADFFLDPVTYVFAEHPRTRIAVWSGNKVNTTSLSIGLYEGLKEDALDPYLFIRDSYHQWREKKVRE